MNGSDYLVDAIAEAVALKLERLVGPKQRLMSLRDAAIYLGMSEEGLAKRAGRDIPCINLDHRLRFDRRDLDALIDRAPRKGV